MQIDIILASKARGRRHRAGAFRRGGARTRAKKELLRQQQQAGPSSEEARREVIEKFKAKKPVYSNCRMLALDGTELASCDLKKLQWYIDKGLAEWEPGLDAGSEQPTIRLNFVHRQDDQDGQTSAFYTAGKANRCVGCGAEDHYLKYRCFSFLHHHATVLGLHAEPFTSWLPDATSNTRAWPGPALFDATTESVAVPTTSVDNPALECSLVQELRVFLAECAKLTALIALRRCCCRIVPDCYRKHFPETMKSHRSHDIVLLCIDCHCKAHTGAERIKRQLADAYSVPLYPSSRTVGRRSRDGAREAWEVVRPGSTPPRLSCPLPDERAADGTSSCVPLLLGCSCAALPSSCNSLGCPCSCSAPLALAVKTRLLHVQAPLWSTQLRAEQRGRMGVLAQVRKARVRK